MELRCQSIPRMVWRKRDFPFFNKDLKLVYFHLMTTPSGTPLGLICNSAEALASEMREEAAWYKERLKEGEIAGLWRYDDHNHVVYMLDYWKWNKPANPKVLTGWLKYLNEIPKSSLLTDCLNDLERECSAWGNNYIEVLKGIRNVYPYVSETPAHTYPELMPYGIRNTVTDTVTETDTEILSNFELDARDGVEGLFEVFWKAYPRHERRDRAKAEFRKLNPTEEVVNEMIRAIGIACRTQQWRDKRFIPLAKNWLLERRWEEAPTNGHPANIKMPAVIEAETFMDESVLLEQPEPPKEWIRALDLMRAHVTPKIFDTWFSPVVCRGISDGVLELSVPTESFRICLLENYLPLLLESAGTKEINIQLRNGKEAAHVDDHFASYERESFNA